MYFTIIVLVIPLVIYSEEATASASLLLRLRDSGRGDQLFLLPRCSSVLKILVGAPCSFALFDHPALLCRKRKGENPRKQTRHLLARETGGAEGGGSKEGGSAALAALRLPVGL